MLGHSNLESTVGYLGIEVDDALEFAERMRCSPAGVVAVAERVGRRPANSGHFPNQPVKGKVAKKVLE